MTWLIWYLGIGVVLALLDLGCGYFMKMQLKPFWANFLSAFVWPLMLIHTIVAVVRVRRARRRS